MNVVSVGQDTTVAASFFLFRLHYITLLPASVLHWNHECVLFDQSYFISPLWDERWHRTDEIHFTDPAYVETFTSSHPNLHSFGVTLHKTACLTQYTARSNDETGH